jgi:hypothetical protein
MGKENLENCFHTLTVSAIQMPMKEEYGIKI